MRVSAQGNQPPVPGSELSVETIALTAGERFACGPEDADTILLVTPPTQDDGLAMIVLAGEQFEMPAHGERILLRATVGPAVDRHAALGERARTVSTKRAETADATGKRSFEILYGPHNGSTRATMFVGHVPPGAAPWHFHLYDEIVWIWRGEGRFHTREGSEPLTAGSAFRIRPREVHVVENTSATDEIVVVGLFTPAGSPSAAYLAEDGDAPYPIEAAP